jgi:hypothetical protein
MLTLNKYLENFKDITVELTNKLKEEDYDAVDSLMEQRQNIIDNIDKLNYRKQDFTNICKELSLLEYNEELEKTIKEKRAVIKEELSKLVINKSANSSYNRKFYSNSVIFSKKI